MSSIRPEVLHSNCWQGCQYGHLEEEMRATNRMRLPTMTGRRVLRAQLRIWPDAQNCVNPDSLPAPHEHRPSLLLLQEPYDYHLDGVEHLVHCTARPFVRGGLAPSHELHSWVALDPKRACDLGGAVAVDSHHSHPSRSQARRRLCHLGHHLDAVPAPRGEEDNEGRGSVLVRQLCFKAGSVEDGDPRPGILLRVDIPRLPAAR
eukprot:scaffold135243_cov34-Tisochrysis_lutea.AAC.2